MRTTSSSILLCLPTLASSFVVGPTQRIPAIHTYTTTTLRAEEGEGDTDGDGLVLGDLDQEMKKVASNLDFGQIDFLAAAKQRAAEKTPSRNSGASDDDWQNLADDKKEKYGEIDDWENSVKEAGNADSQILMFTDPPAGEGEDGEDGGKSKKGKRGRGGDEEGGGDEDGEY